MLTVSHGHVGWIRKFSCILVAARVAQNSVVKSACGERSMEDLAGKRTWSRRHRLLRIRSVLMLMSFLDPTTFSGSTMFGSDHTFAGTLAEFFDGHMLSVDDERRVEGGERISALERERGQEVVKVTMEEERY